jgi:alkylation response protein AidB-like acyl-CoA dehydrogenase
VLRVERPSWAPLGHAELPEPTHKLRREVRAFLSEARAAGLVEPTCDSWLSGFSQEFSRALGERGWIGLTWPAEYGGHGRSALERFVVLEELLAAGAPVAAHWIADRQSGPQIHRYGTDEAKRSLLPAIARGECYFSIGMSEPNSGSDLASIRTAATRVDGGWSLNGTKLWTSHAHRSHYITVLCRTDQTAARHDGMSVLIADLSADGVDIRPIRLPNGQQHFNEVVFTDVFVPDSMLLGRAGEGWRLVTSELALERSGPERFLSTFPLFVELVRRQLRATSTVSAEVGRLAAELWTLRQMSIAVAAAIDSGFDPVIEAALVKDLGTELEARLIEVARSGVDRHGDHDTFDELLAQATLAAPGFSLRGGTSEILRGIVARGLNAAR